MTRSNAYRFNRRPAPAFCWATPSSRDLAGLAQILDLAVIGARHEGFHELGGQFFAGAKTVREITKSLRLIEGRRS